MEVEWAVATDERMRQVVQKGTAIAHPELGHAVHVEVGGLEPGRDYFYQFTIGGERSRTGRARTLPPAGAPVAQLRFGVAGCQRYEDGYFTAFRQIAAERFDFVFHYGDYIYEYRVFRPGDRDRPSSASCPASRTRSTRSTTTGIAMPSTRAIPDLQAAHASAPFVMSYDDHEVDNNWAGATSEEHTRRSCSCCAAPPPSRPGTSTCRCAGPRCRAGPTSWPIGASASATSSRMNVLDTRQLPLGPAMRRRQQSRANCPEAIEPEPHHARRGAGALALRRLQDARARWTVLGQQVIVMRNDRDPDPEVFAPSLDKWDGAVAARDRLFAAIEEAKLANLVVLTGDIHNNWAGELKKNFEDEKLGDPRRRVRGDLDLLGRRRLRHQRQLQGPAPQEPAHQVLQQPARLRPPRGHARALAGRLPGARQGEHAGRPAFDPEELRRRKRQEWARRRVGLVSPYASITIFGAALPPPPLS